MDLFPVAEANRRFVRNRKQQTLEEGGRASCFPRSRGRIAIGRSWPLPGARGAELGPERDLGAPARCPIPVRYPAGKRCYALSHACPAAGLLRLSRREVLVRRRGDGLRPRCPPQRAGEETGPTRQHGICQAEAVHPARPRQQAREETLQGNIASSYDISCVIVEYVVAHWDQLQAYTRGGDAAFGHRLHPSTAPDAAPACGAPLLLPSGPSAPGFQLGIQGVRVRLPVLQRRLLPSLRRIPPGHDPLLRPRTLSHVILSRPVPLLFMSFRSETPESFRQREWTLYLLVDTPSSSIEDS